MITKVVVGVIVLTVLAILFSFIESEAEKDMEERRKQEGPQVLEEEDFE